MECRIVCLNAITHTKLICVVKEEPLFITKVVQTYDYIALSSKMGGSFCFGQSGNHRKIHR
ncbi:hypothetical protein VIBNIAM115_540032 [Vibrio nigripulchritudo AM115]|nr:hypothetical protein VIBNIAM115_540032 [Vibrio nigripulchritudo AM115]